MIRAVGFALVAFAGIGAVVLVTNAQGYESGAPLSYNLRNAVAVDRYIALRERETGLSEPLEECEAPEGWVVWNWLDDPGTPEPERDRESDEYHEWRACLARNSVRHVVLVEGSGFSVYLSFGNAAAALLAVGLLGVGLLAFGPRAPREA